MLRIAVCDDNNQICKEIEDYLHQYALENAINIDIDVFFDADDLVKNLTNTVDDEYNLIFLDIEIGDKYGNDIGNYIRNSLNDNMISIVYVSAYEKYAMSLFKSRPLDFIIKPVSYEKICSVMNVFREIWDTKQNIFNVKVGRVVQQVLCKDIVYLESRDRGTILYLNNGDTIVSNKKLDSFEIDFPFMRVHKSYIINLKYIDKYMYEQVIMTNGVTVPISRVYRKDMRNYYERRLGGGFEI